MSFYKQFDADAFIFYEGEESRYFHFLLSGEVAMIKTSDANDTIAIHRFHAPSFFAEMPTLRSIPYPASAKCTQPCTVLKIDRQPFLQLLRDDPALAISLITSLTQKIATLELSLQRLSAPSAMAKVARLLRDDPEIFIRLRGIDIAHLIGITPETLSRTLKRLKNEGVIQPFGRRGYTVIEPVKLNSLADNNFPFRE